MTIIGLKELRQNASQIAERAQKGERFTVVRRTKTMFTINPPIDQNNDLAAWTEKYITDNKDLLNSLAGK